MTAMATLTLRSISKEAIPRALAKAERYRLLNEPVGAISICLDVLQVEPDEQQALVILLLAMTDQFAHGYQIDDVQPADLLARLTDPYERAYYAGIVDERHAEAVLDRDDPSSPYVAHDLLGRAMRHYEEAERLRPPGNDDALLRWNTCARLMNSRAVRPHPDDVADDSLE
jgi:hypothetical protein